MPDSFLIFGGTFDPPHLAHTALPPLAAAALDCDRIIYVPAAINPLKLDHPPAPPDHRLAMLKLALRDVKNAEISTIELDRTPGGPSYTIDTLRALGRQYPKASMRLLIGSDQALEFSRWKDWQGILELATPAVMLRPPMDRASFRRRLAAQAAPLQADQWIRWILDVPAMDISATDLRRRLAHGESVADLLDPAVADYIRRHHLYESA